MTMFGNSFRNNENVLEIYSFCIIKFAIVCEHNYKIYEFALQYVLNCLIKKLTFKIRPEFN